MGLSHKNINIIKVLVSIVLIVSLWMFVSQTDLSQVRQSLEDVGFGFGWIVLITLIGYVFGALSWRQMLPEDLKISFFRLFYIRLIGENVATINPSNIIGGDGMKAYLLQKEDVPYKVSTASLLMSRLIMMLTQVGIFLLSVLIFFVIKEAPPLLEKIFLGVFALFGSLTLGIVFLFRMSPQHIILVKLRALLGRSKFGLQVIDVLDKVKNLYLSQPRRFYMAVILASLNFLVGSLEFMVIFHCLGIPIDYIDALLIDQGVLVLKSFGAFIPGQIGVEEYSNKVMFGIVGITSSALWIAASILRRSRQLFWLLLSIVLYYFIELYPKHTSFRISRSL